MLFQLVKTHNGYINVVNNINNIEILSTPIKKLIFKNSSHKNLSINWNLDKKKSNCNHKIIEKIKVKSEKIKAILRIKTNLFPGINNKIKEPIKGNNINVNNKTFFVKLLQQVQKKIK